MDIIKYSFQYRSKRRRKHSTKCKCGLHFVVSICIAVPTVELSLTNPMLLAVALLQQHTYTLPLSHSTNYTYMFVCCQPLNNVQTERSFSKRPLCTRKLSPRRTLSVLRIYLILSRYLFKHTFPKNKTTHKYRSKPRGSV